MTENVPDDDDRPEEYEPGEEGPGDEGGMDMVTRTFPEESDK